YIDIGMDHFSLPSDDLFKARRNGKLHRNFMGYTTLHSGLLLGLGVSAISDVGNNFAQNEKTLHDYYAAINAGQLAIKKGYTLAKTDISIKKYILDISCKGETTFDINDIPTLSVNSFPKLKELEADGLIEWNNNTIKLTHQGHFFIRNICSAFDQYLGISVKTINTFSKAI
ncbi:MAG: coproporphyrinogen III oxidase, partial [Chitinophagaceae bacterium]|nr:coproporphyrinogen III oxidase [Chitinophagaceae bacterium]